MHIFIRLAFVSIWLSAVACTNDEKQISQTQASTQVTANLESPIGKDVISAKDEKDCTSKGGGWIARGLGATEKGIKTCHRIHRDGGKPCQDGKECGSRICFANPTGHGGTCAKFAKDSFCSFKKIMVNGKSADEKDCVVE